MTLELNAEAQAVIAKVEKLLALAGNNSNEQEAASASAKAMELLAAYNLDMAVVGKVAGQTGKRADEKLKGGLYQWQRDLWEAIAELNFCRYWSIKGLAKGASYEHRILGRRENVIGARMMAEYLQQTVERLARERMGDPVRFFVREAIAYREGMAQRLIERLNRLRMDALAEEQRKEREARASNGHPGAAPGTAIVLSSVIKSEDDANYDHLYGAGAAARRDARQAEANAAYEAEVRRQQAWDAAHPEEVKAREEKRRRERAEWAKKEERNARRRKGVSYSRADTPQEERRRYRSYGEGYQKGETISLNRQVDGGSSPRIR
jgi:hypothetical protein